MSKVKLVFVKNNVDAPTFKDTFVSDVEVDTPKDFDSFHMIGARVYEASAVPTGMPRGQDDSTIIEHGDVSHLLGQLLTYIDATFTNPEQRKAHKDIVREKMFGWHNDLRTRAKQTVDSHTAPNVDEISK